MGEAVGAIIAASKTAQNPKGLPLPHLIINGRVAELVDATDFKSDDPEGHVGSSPTTPTNSLK